MGQIWRILKKTFIDMWDEMLLMIVFNLIWLFGVLLIITFPFVTFALFYTVKDIGDGKGISFTKFFAYGRKLWKPAYIWGGFNLVVYFLLVFNLRFYGGFQAQWAVAMQIFFFALLVFWSVLQLIMLALYPRQVKPSIKLALRNAAVITGRKPLLSLILLFLAGLLIFVSSFMPALAFIITFSFIALLANNTVQAALSDDIFEPRR